MAKPIEPTPVLKGLDVADFYKTMRNEEVNPNPKRIELIQKGLDVFSRITKK
ncbi:hypothetical protein HY992_02550 [Candidatus Micrarchaeota archaeon]|nr:hypothetical protein [Candidatus Micrarchaeota archaeon]